MDYLKVKTENRLALLTIDRPKVNALSGRVFEELAACFARLRSDARVGAVIVTGAGQKAFVAGADIKELASLDSSGAKQASLSGQAVFRTIEQFPKPVIAAINGFALGGGCELALACHLRLASSQALIGLPEVGLGLIPGYGGTQRLARLVGKGLALELILTGDPIGAQRAFQMGLVNQVTEPDDLLDKCTEIANKILSRGPIAVRHALEAVHHGLEISEVEGELLEANLFGLLAGTADTAEGLTAFIEKRPPVFKGV